MREICHRFEKKKSKKIAFKAKKKKREKKNDSLYFKN